MKTVTYPGTDGPFTVTYDETAPCRICKEPVGDASMGGTDVCPACDCGKHRDTHQKWTFNETILILRDGWTPSDARENLSPVHGKPREE